MPSFNAYINSQNYVKFKEEKNKSSLINKLLFEYYNSKKSLIDRFKEAKIKEYAEQVDKEVEEKYGHLREDGTGTQ